MGTLPPTEVVTVTNENRKLYLEMKQLRVDNQSHAQQLELLQEEAYRVTTTLATTQGIIKQTTAEGVKKMQTHITTYTVDKIFHKELNIKEKATTAKKTFKKFMAH
jgi:hypothetical protein